MTRCPSSDASVTDLEGLDWDGASVHRLEVGEASWAESAEVVGQLRWALLLEGLELLSGHLWQARLDAQQTIEGQVALDLALGQINQVFRWDDELANVVASDRVVLVLDVVGGGDGDDALLGVDLDLDLLWLESLNIKAQVQHARAVHWRDVDWVHEGEELGHGGWAERSITDVRVELVPPRWLLAEPVGPVVRAHWRPVGHWRRPVGHWRRPVRHWRRPVRHWRAPVGHWRRPVRPVVGVHPWPGWDVATEGGWASAEGVHWRVHPVGWVAGLLTKVAAKDWVHRWEHHWVEGGTSRGRGRAHLDLLS